MFKALQERHKPLQPHRKAIAVFTVVVFLLLLQAGEAFSYPENLWKGLVAEDTAGDLLTYRVIASVVRNRLGRGLDHGLVALKRQDLTAFVSKNCAFQKGRGIDLQSLALEAINEVFNQGKDWANGGDHYEHTGAYPTPSWAKNMQVVAVFYKGTKQEITVWKGGKL